MPRSNTGTEAAASRLLHSAGSSSTNFVATIYPGAVSFSTPPPAPPARRGANPHTQARCRCSVPWKAVRTRAVPTFLLRPAARSPRRTTARCARRRPSSACRERGRSGRRRRGRRPWASGAAGPGCGGGCRSPWRCSRRRGRGGSACPRAHGRAPGRSCWRSRCLGQACRLAGWLGKRVCHGQVGSLYRK